MEYPQIIAIPLKEHHLRLTKTRKVLAELFLQNETPLSVPGILREFLKRHISVNKTTVYRELERWQSMGIIDKVQLGDRKQHYELAARNHHHHLVCVRCERVEDVDMDETTLCAEEKKMSREKKFSILRHSLEFFGLCKMCNSVTV